jgi:hypothetical protein
VLREVISLGTLCPFASGLPSKQAGQCDQRGESRLIV